ncbi:MAG: efflux RND transporter permease subunit [Candidatus Izimaplasma sp.]|nr:efflux RND transporter permease subunit [Candidatus Izimaplasma bacterium]
MKNLISYSVNRAITVFMAVIIVIVFGVVSYTNLTTDLLPSLNIPYSVVVTTYPTASPEEVEEVVTKPLEETLATITNVKQITSQSSENFSLLFLEFNGDTDMDSAIIEMRENLDGVQATFPDMVGNSRIIKINPDMMPIMQLSVSKEGLSQQELTNYVEEEVLPQLERVPGVASVSASGLYESELQVLLDEEQLTSYNMQLEALYVGLGVPEENRRLLDKEMISNILKAQNFESPVGYGNIEGINYLIRVGDEFDSVEALSSLVIFEFQGIPGQFDPLSITLADVSEINFVNANDKEYAKVNGENAISISIQKSSDYATTEVTNELNNILSDINSNDSDTDFTVLLDQGEYIKQATGSVGNNLLMGAVLAIIVLMVFLRSARATFIVGISIPISLLFAIILIYFSNITLNIVSLGGLALGIGMLVDNSIVVMENIFRFKKEGYSNNEAAIEGTKEVAGAIFASTLTTVSVFIPVIFIEGFIKEIFMQMALTIAYSLVASLIIALTLVSSISSKILKEDTQKNKEGSFLSKVHKTYESTLNIAFKFKYLVLSLVLILFGGFVFLSLQNGFEYFPASDEGQLTVTIDNPADDPQEYEEFITTLDSISQDFLTYEDIETVGISLGSLELTMVGGSDASTATANVLLKEDRTLTTSEMQVELENLLNQDYQMIEYSISGSQQQTEAMTGSGIQVQLKGYDLDTLKEEAKKIKSIMSSVDGVHDVDSGVGNQADEIKITVDKNQAIEYGITTAQVMGVIANLFAKEEVTTTLTVSSNIYDVYVYDESSNFEDKTYTIEEIENVIVGQERMTQMPIKLNDVAMVTKVKGFSSIDHVDGDRTVTISGEFVADKNVSIIASDVESALEDYTAPEGYSYKILGENEEIMEAMETLVLATLLAIALIYMIMAAQFQSLTYPFIIMFTIPLAFTGGFAILYFANLPISVVAMIGFIILVGVVVNNGIVLVDYTNQLRDSGMDIKEALIEAGKTRLRPIIMTALTTILALSTMALGFGQGAEMMQPMAITTIGGLIYATLLTLLVVPIMYYLLTIHSKGILGTTLIVFSILGGVVGYQILSTMVIPILSAVIIVGIISYLIALKKDMIIRE